MASNARRPFSPNRNFPGGGPPSEQIRRKTFPGTKKWIFIRGSGEKSMCCAHSSEPDWLNGSIRGDGSPFTQLWAKVAIHCAQCPTTYRAQCPTIYPAPAVPPAPPGEARKKRSLGLHVIFHTLSPQQSCHPWPPRARKIRLPETLLLAASLPMGWKFARPIPGQLPPPPSLRGGAPFIVNLVIQ